MVDDYDWALQLIDQCYEAATDDEYWAVLLKDIRRFLDGHGTTLFFTDGSLKPVDRFFGDNVSAESISDYRAHFHKVDIRMQRMVPGTTGSIVTDLDLVDETIIDGHEFYQDFLRPIGHRYVVAAAMDLGDEIHAFFGSHRGPKQDHADRETLDRAKLILPHVQRSLQLRRRLSIHSATGRVAFELLDGLGQAVFLADDEGRIVWQNTFADRLLGQQDGLIASEGELRALAASANTELQKLIKAALAASGRPKMRPGGVMTVPRPSLKRPYQVLVTPLSRAPARHALFSELDVRPSAAVFIMDLEEKAVPPAELLATIYNLTPAEARLATALGSGMSVKAYAESTRLSIHYVRWLLKQVEAKTDTRRLTDLIRLLARQNGFFSAIVDDDNGKDD